MSNLTPSPTFDDVPEIETTTVALGGAGGPVNLPAQALLNRTQYLYVSLQALAQVARSGAYGDLSGLPPLQSAAFQNSSAFATSAQGAKADGAAQASALKSVAFSGSYLDLSNKPSFLTDAPSNGNVYGRSGGAWVVISGTELTNPMTAAGDVIVGGASGAPTRLGMGTTGQVLLSTGTTVAWGSSPTPITTAGDLILGGSGGTPSRLPIGANGTILSVVGGMLTYAEPGVGGQALIVVNLQTGSYTLELTDFPANGTLIDVQITDASASTLTIPPHSAVAAPVGSQAMTSQWGTGPVTVTAGAGVTLVDAFGVTTTAQYDSRYIRQVTTDVWQVL